MPSSSPWRSSMGEFRQYENYDASKNGACFHYLYLILFGLTNAYNLWNTHGCVKIVHAYLTIGIADGSFPV
ncbi:hypothetical protein VTP01DRAFT_1666 [Rhizomucor pusillus]|uniref:uncharacterized protein n=1 Tax=Rhizomucor pusillus TaxID=4840 RepID=UPI0037443EFF